MKQLQPNSILQLTLAGFALAILPLVTALFYAALSVDELASKSERMVTHAVKATEGSRLLAEQLTEMERSLRQYQVLADPLLLEVYAENRARFLDTQRWMEDLPLPGVSRRLLRRIRLDEQSLFEQVTASGRGIKNLPLTLRFTELGDLSQQVLHENQLLIDVELEKTRRAAEESQSHLFWQAVIMVVLALGLVVVFAILITRPIQRLDDEIRRLGAGEFEAPVTLKGPHDLQQLGQRLDWMRVRLLEVEEDKNRFLRHISHELKTPLTTIREGTELLSDEIPGKLSGKQHEIVTLIRENSMQLQRLIEDLLNFNAVVAKQMELNLQTIQFDDLIREVVREHKIAIMAKQLRVGMATARVSLEGDRDKLITIIDNLVTNAIKFSPREGRIEFTLAIQGESAVLGVEDQGEGIDEAHRERVFDAFFQGRARNGGHIKGSGLGLSIAKEYVVAHGGHIEVMDSNQGAHLQVTLPLHQSQEAA